MRQVEENAIARLERLFRAEELAKLIRSRSPGNAENEEIAKLLDEIVEWRKKAVTILEPAQIGLGEDPIGWLLMSYPYIMKQLNEARKKGFRDEV